MVGRCQSNALRNTPHLGGNENDQKYASKLVSFPESIYFGVLKIEKMKNIYWANFFLWTFEWEVLFRNFHFYMEIYRAWNMTGPRYRPCITTKKIVFMSIHLNKSQGVSREIKISISLDHCIFWVLSQRKKGIF